jgi:hypothetical protein
MIDDGLLRRISEVGGFALATQCLEVASYIVAQHPTKTWLNRPSEPGLEVTTRAQLPLSLTSILQPQRRQPLRRLPARIISSNLYIPEASFVKMSNRQLARDMQIEFQARVS